MINLYNKLKEIREEFGYTQDEMAKRLGYNSKSAYNMKEKGTRKVTVEEAYTISRIFNKSIEEIFFATLVAEKTTELKESS